ncbi:ShlB/FhaC/HecB family hemolysin secretion/activation protein [Campylobacter sp. IFREMER_LSEM_CL2101]|uniref:ShlB/FhaC/HecB family hemolysin secretion/activation protein n=1 Tax=Campylobacter sp. IFREMER_LSEM_CL2101 TaxID=2911618 RepID=UPI0021E928FB|nr:ShlB/FhaC/HecB family hemolysin secretion/activation protein [Campylobacter sp. IFREMER_LSEM_CL2101]MCV3392841.1 ShlB/FhaC/HecB family hemolysin secretion/activation protein [Campylobacter sp. IFREMER_LSEM_CL2101]
MKKLLLSTIALSSLVYANNGSITIAKNDIEKVIELSPDRNLPQNKAIKENLKTKDDYKKSQEAKKDFEEKKKELKEKLNQENETNNQTTNTNNDKANTSVNDNSSNSTNNTSNNQTTNSSNTNSINSSNQTNTTTTKQVITKYKFVITNENTSFEKLGIKEEDLQILISEFSTRKFSLQDLQDISNIIAYYFQVNGYPAATAYVPQQEFEDSVQINIALGTLGKYIVKNKTNIKDYFFDSKFNPKDKGKIITTSLVENGIYRLDEMYGIQTLAGLQAGENVGETDIVIEVVPDTKANVLLYSDNYGIKSSGDIRAGISMGFNSIFNMGDYYNFYLQSSNEKQINYGASYTFFLGNLKITPSVSQGSYSLGGKYKDAGFYGTSRNFGIDFSYPMWITTGSSFYLTSSLYHKILSDTRAGFLTFDKSSNVGSMGLEGLFRGFENNALSYSANIIIGKVYDDSDFKFGSKTFGWFRKLNASLNNYYSINEYITHTLNINYQKVLGNFELDSSESSSLGGAYGVRAYDNGEGDGDNTIVANFGIRINIPNTNFYFTPFYDVGYAWYEKDGGRLADEHFLDAVGLQILYNKANEYYIKLDAARALHQYKYDDEHRMKLYLSGGVYF